MAEQISVLANIVTILGFPFSIFMVIRELKSGTKAIYKLISSIKQQQTVKNEGIIENLYMNNSMEVIHGK
ncbi:MAG: hypothetical protein NT141_04370 [candidate division WWE3 bacterium]|nr:hypothetical protein [candidate division WWE3 bacterium]